MSATVETITNILDQLQVLDRTLANTEVPSDPATLLNAAESLAPRLEKLSSVLYSQRESINAQACSLAHRLEHRAVTALQKGLNDPDNPAFAKPPTGFHTAGNRCKIAMVDPRTLPENHVAMHLLPPSDLYLCGDRAVLVLGSDDQQFFRCAAVAELTKSWRTDQVKELEQKKAKEAEQQQRREREYEARERAKLPAGTAAEIEGLKQAVARFDVLEKKLAALEAVGKL